jgi:hypothetical protein
MVVESWLYMDGELRSDNSLRLGSVFSLPNQERKLPRCLRYVAKQKRRRRRRMNE